MRVVTWNIRGGKGVDGKRSLRRVVRILSECDADVICLQEVHRYLPLGAMEDQPARLAEELGMQVAFAPAMRYVRGFGNALLSRLPMENWKAHPLPNPRERKRSGLWLEQRALQEAQVVARGDWVTIFNTHWSLDAQDRLDAAQVIAGMLAPIAGPIVFCGDLNAHPRSREIHLLAESGLVDCGTLGDTPTYPADAPRLRIDYVWTRGMTATAIRVLSTSFSDHRPVIVDLAHETVRARASSTVRNDEAEDNR